MGLLRKGFGRKDLSEPVWERIAQVAWVLDYLDDIDADFLAIYGIDLLEQEVSARRYFALIHRLPAYQGVLAVRREEAREEQEDPGEQKRSSTPTRTSTEAAPAGGSSEVREVSLTQFRAFYPGLISMAQGG